MTHVEHPVFDLTVDTSRHEPVQFDGSQSCSGVPTEAFYYSHNGPDEMHDPWVEQDYTGNPGTEINAMLARICITCPLLEECFSYALYHEEYGFWGGVSPVQRKRLREEYDIELKPAHDSDVFDMLIKSQRLAHELELSLAELDDE